jgi:hypothetical protein
VDSGEALLLAGPVALAVWFVWSLMKDRDAGHRRTARRATEEGGGLRDVTENLFDDPPVGRVTDAGVACVEGKRAGETLSVRADYDLSPARRRALDIGPSSPVTALVSVVVNLRGATLDLELRAKPNAPIESKLELGFDVDGDATLLDDETKALIVGSFVKGLPVRRIHSDREGLHIEWLGGGGAHDRVTQIPAKERWALEKAERTTIEVAADLATALQRRILDELERRGHQGLQPGKGYREPQR